MSKYGTATCLAPVSLNVWDGSNDTVQINLGDVLDISYHEYDGTLGLMKDGVELICDNRERRFFQESWDYKAGGK